MRRREARRTWSAGSFGFARESLRVASTIQPDRYGPIFAELLQIDRRRALDGGTPETAAQGRLESLTVERAFADTGVVDVDMARCCLAGVWLLHDFLDQSHTLSQGVSTVSGSFWHGIMHRREGDFSNAKYWFHRVGDHPLYPQLAEAVGALADQPGAANVAPRIVAAGAWDAFAFVDACQQNVHQTGDQADFCRRVQQVEWERLFDYCYRGAVRRA